MWDQGDPSTTLNARHLDEARLPMVCALSPKCPSGGTEYPAGSMKIWRWRVAKARVEFHVIARDVEAGMVKTIECVDVIPQREAFIDLEDILEGTDVEVILGVDGKRKLRPPDAYASVLERVTGWYTICSGRARVRNAERRRIQLVCIYASRALKNRIRSAEKTADRHDWVCNGAWLPNRCRLHLR